jgi:hypothetical protein
VIKPSLWWFGVAAAIGVGGIALVVFLLVRTFVVLSDKIDDFERVDVPGSGTITLDGTGGYTLYHEFPGADDDVRSPSLQLTMTAPDGSDVDLRDYTSTVTYSDSGHEGVAVWSFTATEPGAYQLDTEGERSTVAVGRGVGRHIAVGIISGIATGLASVVVAGVIAIVVGVRRSSNRQRLRWAGQPPPQPSHRYQPQQAQWPGPPPPSPPPPPPPPPFP